jgi:hypothetical protein
VQSLTEGGVEGSLPGDRQRHKFSLDFVPTAKVGFWNYDLRSNFLFVEIKTVDRQSVMQQFVRRCQVQETRRLNAT